jgi:hypothetical protein
VIFSSSNSCYSFPVHSATPPSPSLSYPSPTPSLPSPTPPPVASFPPDIAQLLFHFPSVPTPVSSRWPTPSHSTRHHIHTTGPAISSHAHHLSPEQLLEAEKVFRERESLGIIRSFDSLRSSSLHMVPKPNGSWWPCGDYRRLNSVTTADKYPCLIYRIFQLSCIAPIFFSKIDLEKGYYQIPMNEADILKTAIITPLHLDCLNFFSCFRPYQH